MLVLAFFALTVGPVHEAPWTTIELVFARVSVHAQRAYYVEQLPDEWPRTDECDEW